MANKLMMSAILTSIMFCTNSAMADALIYAPTTPTPINIYAAGPSAPNPIVPAPPLYLAPTPYNPANYPTPPTLSLAPIPYHPTNYPTPPNVTPTVSASVPGAAYAASYNNKCPAFRELQQMQQDIAQLKYQLAMVTQESNQMVGAIISAKASLDTSTVAFDQAKKVLANANLALANAKAALAEAIQRKSPPAVIAQAKERVKASEEAVKNARAAFETAGRNLLLAKEALGKLQARNTYLTGQLKGLQFKLDQLEAAYKKVQFCMPNIRPTM